MRDISRATATVTGRIVYSSKNKAIEPAFVPFSITIGDGCAQ